MPASPYRISAFDRIVLFLSTERARTAVTTIDRRKTLCPDKSNK